jgi:hypothetical protein
VAAAYLVLLVFFAALCWAWWLDKRDRRLADERTGISQGGSADEGAR